ncbi:DNA internalization-related competence protein ComEC/Rec2 [Shewanella marinintestina]|uniref:DNA internalization-related competence protein ComEC/Rec2 n=1 Tax=Shewanella marinintestina TaxID=190305 RepID=UPI00200DE1AF|nr:DNA internalization-related competence protein ComEC/Rec2 [Shewanella marinintestina]MCL1145737.1 DNA internalization-related competence protein ComEC/Rec2 [Shewanella marinintestina]
MFWPSLVNLYILPFLIVVVITACRRFPFVAGGLLAICWISVFYSLLMGWNTGERVATLDIEGEIISLVQSNSDRISVDITLIDSISPHIVHRKLRLYWQQPPPEVSPGQRWLFSIKPKPITSILNQGGFNQQKHLLAKHIIGKGSVKDAKLLTKNLSYRENLIARLKPELAVYPSHALLLALLTGDKSLITNKEWQQLRSTGAGHLFAISGLHLSVVSLWLLLISQRVLYRLFPISSRRNWLLCLAFSASGALFYGYLAGFSVSTQRALIMLLAYICFSAFSRHSSSWERLLYALFIILLFDPVSILSASFWLSFGALSIILLTVSRYDSRKPITKISKIGSTGMIKRSVIRLKTAILVFWSLQWRLTIALGVIQAIFFQGMSLISLFINIILVPWFSLVLIPICLLSLLIFMLLSQLGMSVSGVFVLAAWAMEPVVALLNFSENLGFAWLILSDELIAGLILASLGCYLMFNFKHKYWRLLLSVMLLPLILSVVANYARSLDKASFARSALDNKRWQVHLLDVGQGLSVVIEHNRRGVIYDTGARYGEHFSYAQRALEPFLLSQGIIDIDYIIISHSDNDHAGGVGLISKAYPKALLVSDLWSFSQIDCRPKQFSWGKLKIELLAPKVALAGNNGSCVVKVSDDFSSVLLTGDIEKQAERALVNMNAQQQAEGYSQSRNLASRLLVAPHHGSDTSSTTAFIEAVSPELVVFPAGFRNRYGFPKKEVVERYQLQRIPSITVGQQGQVSVLFHQQTMKVRTYRSDFAPFWYNQVFRFGQIQNPE